MQTEQPYDSEHPPQKRRKGVKTFINIIGGNIICYVDKTPSWHYLYELDDYEPALSELGRNPVSMEMSSSKLTRGGTAEPVSRDQILRRERGQGNINFPCSADHV